ncbi:MAG: amino acid permease [Acidimicrobiales bacterium]
MKIEPELAPPPSPAAAGAAPGAASDGASTAARGGPRLLPTTVDVPESGRYRLKSRFLGPPLHTEQLAHERLGIPTAVAVFSSDCISSSAYATEEILRVLIPAVGFFAFSLVVPITTAMIIVLFFLILSYRETIKEYPTAGGAYMVTRDNFGLLPAQVAGVSLLTDYILTVAVSVAAGTDALTSFFPALTPYHVAIALGFIAIIAFGNLRGVKESGFVFAMPTYFFMIIMGLLLLFGIAHLAGIGHFQPIPIGSGAIPGSKAVAAQKGVLNLAGDGIFYGATLYIVLHAFASGGAAVTGVEAISNGVTAFKKPEWKNARVALFIMGGTLAIMFFGLSALSTKVHPVPYLAGTPTVISQIGKSVFGSGAGGGVLYFMLQAGTMLILVLAANTSFADFPRLASFHAGDNFMPKQLTKRGHRLVFSNGIISLAMAAGVLVLVTSAQVSRLIPLYAIGVFTSFTMSQAGMAKHHLTKKEPGWQKGLFVNATGAVLSAIVDAIILVTKFMHGAWFIVVLVPIMVYALTRLNKQYEAEAAELERDAPQAAEAPILAHHVVLVLVDRLDLASARAIQYARTLTPDELRAVHFVIDPQRAAVLSEEWRRLGLSRLPLELVDCPDRRLARAAVELVAETLADGQTEVSVLLPHIVHNRTWHRILHDRTADQIAAAVGSLPHANVTFVPYHLGSQKRRDQVLGAVADAMPRRNGKRQSRITSHGVEEKLSPEQVPEGSVPIASVTYRQRARVAGRVRSMRVQPWHGVATLECTLVDDTGGLLVVFLGRRQVAGIAPGAKIVVEGMVGENGGRLAILNPEYRIIAGAEDDLQPHADPHGQPAHH